MNNLAVKFISHARAHGVRPATRRALEHLRLVHDENAPPTKQDIISQYKSILGHPHGARRRKSEVDIQWVVPNFGSGSGGHLNIFRFINLLAKQGVNQRLVILPPFEWSSPDQARLALERWYFPLTAEIALGVDGFCAAGATIATGWQTAYWVHHHRASSQKFYFVQDFEPLFYPQSSTAVLAENTYRLGLQGITAGPWLQSKLETEFSMPCTPISFSCDMEFYRPTARRPNKNFNILFYARHTTPRRLFEIGLLSLAELCKKHPKIAVIFAGGNVSGFHIPFHHLNAGELKLSELPDLYSQSDLALVLSGSNLSLLPLEIAACHCPMVLNDDASANWLLPRNAAFYAQTSPTSLTDVMEKAYKDPKARASKAKQAFHFAALTSWEAEAKKLNDIIGGRK